jgi:hypothetical protein
MKLDPSQLVILSSVAQSVRAYGPEWVEALQEAIGTSPPATEPGQTTRDLPPQFIENG